jgi:hypothetical protein
MSNCGKLTSSINAKGSRSAIAANSVDFLRALRAAQQSLTAWWGRCYVAFFSKTNVMIKFLRNLALF